MTGKSGLTTAFFCGICYAGAHKLIIGGEGFRDGWQRAIGGEDRKKDLIFTA